MYQERTYRKRHAMTAPCRYQAVVAETDLWITSDQDRTEAAAEWVKVLRGQVSEAEAVHPGFLNTLEPLPGKATFR